MCTKVNSRWTKDRYKNKIIILLEENIGKIFNEFRVKKVFSITTTTKINHEVKQF